MNSKVNRYVWFAFGLGIIAITIVLILLLSKFRPQAPTIETKRIPPSVSVMKLEPENVPLSVFSQGEVMPQHETTLAAEVSGKIVQISPSFEDGDYVKKGEKILEIDPRNYRAMRAQMQAQVASAELALIREKAEREQALAEWKKLNMGSPPPLAAHEPQIAKARSDLASAQAALEKAKLDLDRTVVRSPFNGRIRSKMVDVGQYVTPGMSLANLFTVDVAEVKLPLTPEELDVLGLSVQNARMEGPKVTFKTDRDDSTNTWHGCIVRVEGTLDRKTRMVNVVAQIQDPYRMTSKEQSVPLAIGDFVTAEIHGPSAENAIRIPRIALRGKNNIHIVDASNHLHLCKVKVILSQKNQVIIRYQGQEGDRVSLTQLEAPVENMSVTPVESEPATQP